MYAVNVLNVSKIYRLYQKPSDRLKEALFRKKFHQPFESLKNITFSLPIGDSLGIIGDNGAGKSTLLKILAKTLTPTSGNVMIKGRVAALLELGAGFHPEFTGRQNIYLNASLMGLSQPEIRKKEDTIIDFAELGQFIDRPIKIYSSGMVVRLAFAIATSVDPDILIIDEALSVGDQYFQKKCIDRMLAFRDKGKTILFCSHSMYPVNLLCKKAVWLEKGQIRKQGAATHVIAAYEDALRAKNIIQENNSEVLEQNQDMPVFIKTIFLNNHKDTITIKSNDDLSVILEYESLDDRPFWIAIGIRRNDELICHAVSLSQTYKKPLSGKGTGRILIRYSCLPFFHGEFYVVGVILDDTGLHCYHKKESAPFIIAPPDQWHDEMGLLDLKHEWKIL